MWGKGRRLGWGSMRFWNLISLINEWSPKVQNWIMLENKKTILAKDFVWIEA